MPKCDLLVQKPVSTTFSKLLHFQSWVKLASQPKSWCQHVSCSMAFSSRQSQSVLHLPDIKQCRDRRCLSHFDSGHERDVENQGWSPCFHKYWLMQHGKGLTKEAENFSYFSPHLLIERQAPIEFCSKSSRREAWTCIFRGRNHIWKNFPIPDV